jgi:hypothetical protein
MGVALALVGGVPVALSGRKQAVFSIEAYLEPVDDLQSGIKACLRIPDAIKPRLASWKDTSSSHLVRSLTQYIHQYLKVRNLTELRILHAKSSNQKAWKDGQVT